MTIKHSLHSNKECVIVLGNQMFDIVLIDSVQYEERLKITDVIIKRVNIPSIPINHEGCSRYTVSKFDHPRQGVQRSTYKQYNDDSRCLC